MKNPFNIAALVALALTLMVACKPNEPENYQEKMDELTGIINSPEEEQMEITIENLTGIWENIGDAWGTNATDLNYIRPKATSDDDYYYTFHLDKSYELNCVRKANTISMSWESYSVDMKHLAASNGIWNLSNNNILLKYCESCNEQTLRIHSLTKDALVISMDSKNGDGTDIIVFNIYKRITESPELPLSLDESLMQYDWILESDSVLYRHIVQDEYGGIISMDVIDSKINQLKQNLVWQFRKSGEERVFTETDAEGNVLHNSVWTTADITLNLYFNEDYSLTDFYKSLNIQETVQTYRNYLNGFFYLSDGNKTLHYLHSVESIEPEKRFEYPITVMLTFKAK